MNRQFFIAAILLVMMDQCVHRAAADQIALGLVTIHHTNPNQIDRKFSGCLHASCEAIYNPVLAYRMMEQTKTDYTAYTLLGGVNSIHEPIVGAYVASGLKLKRHKIGFAAGMYLQDNKKFNERGIIPFSFEQSGGIGIVPIVGAEHQYRLTKSVFINTLVTPVITNVGIGLQF